jgi:thiamine biosynthesis lipoprotein
MGLVKLSTEAMATRFELIICGDDTYHLRSAGEEALEEAVRLDAQLSAFKPESEISYINAQAGNEPVRVEARLFRLLLLCKDLTRLTGNLFDVTIGPLIRCWGLHLDAGTILNNDELDAAKALVGMDLVELDEDQLTVRLGLEGMSLDLGGVGKGYAVDRMIETLRELGVVSALVHAGTSTVSTIGTHPDGRPWKVAVGDRSVLDTYRPTVDMTDSSLSISDTHGRYFKADGQEFGHVINPETGEPISARVTSRVIGPSATICDALSTAALVLAQQSLSLTWSDLPDYDCRIVCKLGMDY